MWSRSSSFLEAQQAWRSFDLVYAVAVSMDYTTVGHVTVDMMADGSRRPGGSAFYSALQAARLGARALIVTRGVRAELESLLAPYRGELELRVIEAEHTTTLQTCGVGRTRAQRMLAWAGAIGSDVRIDTAIAHLAPVARETPARWRGSAGFVGVTPQGLVRDWSGRDAHVVACALDLALLPARSDAIVLSESERESCSALLADDARQQAPVIAVTAAAAPTELHLPDGEIVRVDVPRVEPICDDVGAGDVFAAAFFLALADGASASAAASFANAAAAVRIAGSGPEAIGDRAAIEARVATVA
jgi:sugar/nucleoside kinase (ribokinase family)